jgi:hypothetical protein
MPFLQDLVKRRELSGPTQSGDPLLTRSLVDRTTDFAGENPQQAAGLINLAGGALGANSENKTNALLFRLKQDMQDRAFRARQRAQDIDINRAGNRQQAGADSKTASMLRMIELLNQKQGVSSDRLNSQLVL